MLARTFKLLHAEHQLPQIVVALGTQRRVARGLHGGQDQRHQDADDADDHEQFDKRKTATRNLAHDGPPSLCTKQTLYETNRGGTSALVIFDETSSRVHRVLIFVQTTIG